MGELDGAGAAVTAPTRPRAPSIRRGTSTTCLLVLALASMAHVGSPDTFFSGQAGPYPVHVAVRLPGVIPGLAQITVRIGGGAQGAVSSVSVQAIQWNVGPEGAPPPDLAEPVPGAPDLYSAALWFMGATSYRVHVTVEGREGRGTTVVPVVALATAQREMPRAMGLVLAGLGVFLIAGLVTIVGAAVRESVLAPGEAPDGTRRRRARTAMTAGAILFAAIVVGGRAWWNAEALAYNQLVLFRPFASSAMVRDLGDRASGAARRVLTLSIDDRRWPPAPGNVVTRYNSLMPDHGKLMHMFLIREPALDAFAHLHPIPHDPPKSFDVDLPPLPAGRYRVYADIVHESGYAQTLVTTVDLGDASAAQPEGDRDDSWFDGETVPASATQVFRLADGGTVTWERVSSPLIAGAERELTFIVRDAAGAPADLEPYMGMAGHVIVARTEGEVFAHLHPSGSVSMAALQKFAKGLDPHALHQAAPRGEVSTLYAFPRAGRYRVWVQIKRTGQVETSSFDVVVNPRTPEP